MNKEEEGSSFTEANDSTIGKNGLLYILLVDRQSACLWLIFDRPAALLPEQPGMET